MKKKILYILSHPIQYQSPLIKKLNKSKKIELDVMYETNYSIKKYFDHEMNKKIKFDVDLLSDYNYDFASTNGKINFFKNIKKFIFLITKKKYNYIWLHGYDNFSKLFIIILSKIFFLKVIIRGESSHYSLKNKNKISIYIKKIFFYFLNFFTNYFLVIGKSNYKFYKEMNIKNEKLKMIYYVVDNLFFQSKMKKIKKKKKIVFLYASKLIEKKNPKLLINSFKKLPENLKKNSKLVIVGDGILRNSLKKKYKDKNIYFKGFVNQNKICNFYNNCDVFILPSKEENWGLVVNEVMNFKKPILCSSLVGCNLDLVKNNFNGYIFQNNNEKDLTKKLQNCFNKKKLNKFGKNSFAIINKWNIDYVINQFEKII
jgi:glycosyltransferase involved in cell wall biosynthesis